MDEHQQQAMVEHQQQHAATADLSSLAEAAETHHVMVDMHQGGHGQEMEPGEVPGDEAGVAGVVSQTQTAMAEAGAEGLTWTDGQAAAVGETVSYQTVGGQTIRIVKKEPDT